jgi:uncharacterized protein YhaN
MKILKLNLTAFGPFTDAVLDFSSGREGLNLVYGPNEAGKSSSLRALVQLLYGIPVRSPDSFIHPYGRLRIGGTLRRSDGQVLEIIRRKAQSNTLRGPDDADVIPESRLAAFLGGVDEGHFTTLFGIDHERLVRGGEDIIRGGGSIGQILFAAGSGISDFRKIQTDFQAEAEALFKPAAQKPRINELISTFKETQKNIRESQLSSGDWARHDLALREAESRKFQVEAGLSVHLGERNRLQRIQESLPIIARRKELLAEYEAFAGVVSLPDDFSDRRRNAFEELKIAQARESRSTERLEEIRNTLSGVIVPERLIAAGDLIHSLFQDLGSVRKAGKDQLELKGRRDSLWSEAREILRGIKPGIGLDQAESLRLEKRQIIRIQELGDQYEGLRARAESVRETIQNLTLRIQTLQDHRRALEIPPDTSDLETAVEAARVQGDMEARHHSLTTEIRKMESALTSAVQRLPLWDKPPDDLEQIKVPSPEAIEDVEYRLKTAGDALTRCQGEQEAADRDLADIEARIQELNLTGGVPSEKDLQQAREHREAGWQQVRNAWESGDQAGQGADSFIREFPRAATLADAYEMSVRKADDLSDRLRREAGRVIEKAGLTAAREKIKARLESLQKTAANLQNDLARTQAFWETLWKSAGIAPGSPREMRSWVQKQSALASQNAALREQKTQAADLLKRIEAARLELLTRLEAAGKPGDKNEPLARLIGRAVKILEYARQTRTKQEGLVEDLREREAELREARDSDQKTSAEMSRWRDQWDEALRPLGLSPDATPSQARSVVEDIKTLFSKLREAGILDKRFRSIEEDSASFAQKVAELTARESHDLSGRSPDQAVMELNSRLQNAQKSKIMREGLEKQGVQEEKSLAESHETIARIRARLDAMRQEARCESDEDLPKAEQQSERRKQIETHLSTIENDLRRLSAGATLDRFVQEAESVDPDAINPRITRLNEQIRESEQEKSQLDQAIGAERTELKRMDGSRKAAELAEQAQSILARMESEVGQYVRLRLASAVLSHAIEQYREKNQGPVLTRAGELFSRMTLGSFEGLRLEFNDKNEGILTGIRPGGRETVGVEGMSEGTADQLYLAIRLASLEAWLDKNEPLPFIVDDILIKFDDQRAGAALEALAQVSRKTQVIFFTHHRHLLDVAEKRLNGEVLFTHVLGEHK